ncbi:MAG TPA: tetratricopeptide repeat protein [Vicinamibacteria bacterium]
MTLTGATLSLVLAAVTLSLQSPPADPLREVRALIDAGKPAAAIEKLKTLDAAAPRVAEMLGVAYYHAGDPLRAIEQLAAVVDRLPEGSLERREAVQVLGLSHYLAGHLAEAVPFLEKTREIAPDNLELSYALGMAYIQTRQPTKARESWARTFRAPPDSAAAHLVTAQMMIRAGMDEMAEAELKQALAKDARLPHVHFLLGQTALFRGRLDEAVALLQREIEVSPGDSMAFYRLGDAFARRLEWDAAIASLQRSIWLNPYFSGPYILLGRAFLKKGDTVTAEGMLRRAVQYDPNNKAGHYMLGQLLQQTGRAEEARRELEIAEKLPETSDR